MDMVYLTHFKDQNQKIDLFMNSTSLLLSASAHQDC